MWNIYICGRWHKQLLPLLVRENVFTNCSWLRGRISYFKNMFVLAARGVISLENKMYHTVIQGTYVTHIGIRYRDKNRCSDALRHYYANSSDLSTRDSLTTQCSRVVYLLICCAIDVCDTSAAIIQATHISFRFGCNKGRSIFYSSKQNKNIPPSFPSAREYPNNWITTTHIVYSKLHHQTETVLAKIILKIVIFQQEAIHIHFFHIF
jgi:hypothetical protein